MYLLGLDIGSSSIKAAIVDSRSKATVIVAKYPESEMDIQSPQIGYAEQDPELWWEYSKKAIQKAIEGSGIKGTHIVSIGISYQMHGLVVVDHDYNSLRPAIIWCDDRAVESGKELLNIIGSDYANDHLLNNPGNFTASKLAWVKQNEPELFEKIYKIMLPGDFIAMKLSGEINTTVQGLSEGMFWDYKNHEPNRILLDALGMGHNMLPRIVGCFDVQAKIDEDVARDMGLNANVIIGYRAGDQPNNAMSLSALRPGDIATTGGTSGVVYAVTDQYIVDEKQRVNTFAHVNHTQSNPKLGVLLCINGAGIQYSWIKKQLEVASYQEMERIAEKAPRGSQDLMVHPFGNGGERMLQYFNQGANISGLHFSIHNRSHLVRATLEGIAFSFVYGCDVLKDMKIEINHIKAGADNLFQSAIFASTIADLLQAPISLIETTGAVGAALGSGVALGLFSDIEEAVSVQNVVKTYHPSDNSDIVKAYERWKNYLNKLKSI